MTNTPDEKKAFEELVADLDDISPLPSPGYSEEGQYALRVIEHTIIMVLKEAGGSMADVDELRRLVADRACCSLDDVSSGLGSLAGDMIDIDNGPDIRLIKHY